MCIVAQNSARLQRSALSFEAGYRRIVMILTKEYVRRAAVGLTQLELAPGGDQGQRISYHHVTRMYSRTYPEGV